MSHPAILHHFKSREGLVDAVLERAVQHLQAELMGAFTRSVDAQRAAELLGQVFEVLGDQGHARLLAWLILAGPRKDAAAKVGSDETLRRLSEALSALALCQQTRVARRPAII